MADDNKTLLQKANAAITVGDYEGFLSFCTEETVWTFVGDRTLQGKQAVRDYMKVAYAEPPTFVVDNLIAEGDFVTAVGKISMKDQRGEMIDYSYCDVWQISGGKLDKLQAFLIKAD